MTANGSIGFGLVCESAAVAPGRWLSGRSAEHRKLREALYDPDVFGAFYERHASDVLRFAARRVLDAEVAMDVTAESFAVALTKLGQLRADDEQQEAAWLYAIVRSQLSAYWRRGVVERRAFAQLGLDPIHSPTAELERMEQLSELRELRPRLVAALGRLPDGQRHAVWLRIVEELDYEAISRSLGVSEQVVRRRVSRGLRRLGQLLEDEAAEEHVA